MTIAAVRPLDLHRLIDQAAWIVPTAAVRVARALVGKIRNETASWPPTPSDPRGVSVRSLANVVGLSPEHVRRALRVLESLELIETVQRPWQTSYYRILVPAWEEAARLAREQLDRIKARRPRTIPLPSPSEVARRGLAWLTGAEGAAGAGLPPRRSADVDPADRRTAAPPSAVPRWAREAAQGAPVPPSPAEVVSMVAGVADRLVPGCLVADRNKGRRAILAWWAEEGHPPPAELEARAAALGEAVATSPALAHLRQPRGRFGVRRPVAEDLRALLRRRGELQAAVARLEEAPGDEPREGGSPAGALACPRPPGPPAAAEDPATWWRTALQATRRELEAAPDLPAPLVEHLVAGLGPPALDERGQLHARVPDRGAASMLAPVLGRVSAELQGWPVVLEWGGPPASTG